MSASSRVRGRILEEVSALAACSFFAWLALPGFAAHAAHHLTPDGQDPLLNLVFLKWGAHQWRLGLPDFWNANFFYPAPGVMTLSDHLLGPSLALAMLAVLGVGPILGYNLILLAALAASPYSCYWLLRRLGSSWGAALVAALAWGFAAFRLSHVAHLQLLLALWIPPLLWSFDRLLARPSPARVVLFSLFYWLHLSGGNYLAYMVHVLLLAICVSRAREILDALRKASHALWLCFGAGACALAIVAIYVPYLHYGALLGLGRTPEEWEQFGSRWASFLTPARGTVLDDLVLHRFGGAEHALFPGAVLLLLAGIAIASARPLTESPLERALLAGSVACLALSFGGVFSAVAGWLPGLDNIRVPARFVQLAGLGFACLAARGFDVVLRRSRSIAWRGALITAALLLVGGELLPASARWTHLGDEAEFAPVDHWIAARPEIVAYVDLPFPPPNRLTREAVAMYVSTLHWKKIVNGRSGYAPETWRTVYEAIPVMPDADALELLRGLGVTHVVVRSRGMYEERWRREAFRAWSADYDAGRFPELEVVYDDDQGDRVLKILPAG